jgi:exopolyphosphatase / guanosine-5'-triphosphate,3'-diphosphate pyrophosphatase
VCACVDIGSNTTRLLVADASDGRLRELMTQRDFTRLGSAIRKTGEIPEDKLEETAAIVIRQAEMARHIGAGVIAVVATAAIRGCANAAELGERVREGTGLPLRILSAQEEARLSFVGATATLGAPVEGRVVVVDVGGGSTEVAAGTVPDGVDRSDSFRIGSGLIADSYLRSDPPGAGELHAARQHVAGAFEGFVAPGADAALAVGGSATSLRRLCGGVVDHETLERGVRILAQTPRDEVSRRFELDPERVRLLPAGILILEELSDRLGMPLTIAKGGLREGVILETVAGRGP